MCYKRIAFYRCISVSSFLRFNLKYVAPPYVTEYQVGQFQSRYERGDKMNCVLTTLAVKGR